MWSPVPVVPCWILVELAPGGRTFLRGVVQGVHTALRGCEASRSTVNQAQPLGTRQWQEREGVSQSIC